MIPAKLIYFLAVLSLTWAKSQKCRTVDGHKGKCVPNNECTLLDDFHTSSEEESTCPQQGSTRLVCCPKHKPKKAQKEIPRELPVVPHSTNFFQPWKPVAGLAPYQDEKLYVPGTNIPCGWEGIFKSRIVGGEKTTPGEFPWIAVLGYKDRITDETRFLCGGVLVSDRIVVTASHCVHNTSDPLAVARLGDYDISSTADEPQPLDVLIETVTEHPKYIAPTYQYDIAILKLKEAVPFSPQIHPICLPYTKQLREFHFQDYIPTVAGWGSVDFNAPSSQTLLKVQLPLVDLQQCKENFSRFRSSRVDDTNMCAGVLAGGKDSCQGDSGGPLMFPLNGKVWVTIGVVSYGFKCAQEGYPGVYSRVTHHVDWIIEHIKAAAAER